MKQLTITFLILICVLFATTIVGAQTNLLIDEKDISKPENWCARGRGEATIEEINGDKVFVVPKDSWFRQDVKVNDAAIGKYALFIGLVSSERAASDKPIPVLPYIYVWIFNPGKAMRGQKLSNDAKSKNEWVVIYGIFPVEKEANLIRFFLYQSESNDASYNDSTRFKNVGLYLFETEEDALKFAKAYK
jgi:hypothetical protein